MWTYLIHVTIIFNLTHLRFIVSQFKYTTGQLLYTYIINCRLLHDIVLLVCNVIECIRS